MSYTVGQTAALDFDAIVDTRTDEPLDPLPSNIRFEARGPDGEPTVEYDYPTDPELSYDNATGGWHVNVPLDTAGVWEGELSWGVGDDIGESPFRLYVFEDIGYRPSVADVSARLYARTLDTNGNRGVFNETTSPTADQIDVLIDDALAIVTSTVGGRLIPKAHWPSATYAVICRVAMAVEREFLPETSNDDFSSYRAWLGEYNVAISALTVALSSDQPNVARYTSIPIVPPRQTLIDPVTNELL